MFQTKSLASFKLLPNLHKPLPLNRREAQHLLDTLTTSFRKHLDKEHGWLPDEAPTAATPQRTVATAAAATHHRRPTDLHLSSILSNPLFNPPTISPSPTNPGASASAVHANHHPHGVATFARETAVFTEAVAKGMMNVSRAHGFLIAVRNSILRSSFLTVQDGMQASGAGALVSGWLQSSGLETDLAFLNNEAFLRVLVPFMIASGQEERLWTWLERIHDYHWSLLLNAIVRAKTLDGGTLDAAYAGILRGEELLLKDNNNNNHNHNDYQSLASTWLTVWWQSTVKAWRFAPAREDLFEGYVAISDRLQSQSPRRPLVTQRAHLDLHHPNPAKTTPDRAVRLFVEDGPRKGWREALGLGGGLGGGVRGRSPSVFKANEIMSLGLDTVKYLSEAGDSLMAQRILEILQREIQPLFPGSRTLAPL
ncbi:hypothetical protein GE09DRAFT_133506 [Coniochaeta sp. 2T2.1]|nr:hypothetical protein GE09DRAFT_133506 [Coniochaeta sp. 2T2.1]